MSIITDFLLRLLTFFYKLSNNYGVAIIMLTLVFRIITLPLNIKQVRSTKVTNALMPEKKALEEKYKNDKEKLSKATLELYNRYKFNPLAGCLPLLIQFPIFIAMFRVIQETGNFPNTMFLGLDLSMPDKLLGITGVLPLLAGITTYIQSKQSTSSSQIQSTGNSGTLGTMNAIMPSMIIYFSSTMAAGLALYWFVGNLFSIVQHYFINHFFAEIPSPVEEL